MIQIRNSPVKPRRLSAIILIFTILVTAYDLFQIQDLRNKGMFLRFQQVDADTFEKFYQRDEATPEELAFFAPKLAQAGISQVNGDNERILFVLKWVMSQVKYEQLDSAETAIEAFQRAQKGEGLSCESMCKIFVAAARSAKFKARSVQLVRSVLNVEDTHVTAEVLLDHRWVIFDPTFNVSYRKGSQLIGAKEIRQSLLEGTSDTIKPIFYGEVPYPARITSYYLNWLPLYNNILLFNEHKGCQLPPFRFWCGPQWDYLETSSTGLWHFQSANSGYFIYSVMLPVICFLLLVLSTALYLFSRQRAKIFEIERKQIKVG